MAHSPGSEARPAAAGRDRINNGGAISTHSTPALPPGRGQRPSYQGRHTEFVGEEDTAMKIMLGVLGVLVLAGCATLADVVRDKDDGTAKVYPVTFDQAWTISKAVFRWEGTDAIEEHKDERYMLTSSGMNLVTFGTVMGPGWTRSPTAR
jgi:hypothetical protein